MFRVLNEQLELQLQSESGTRSALFVMHKLCFRLPIKNLRILTATECLGIPNIKKMIFLCCFRNKSFFQRSKVFLKYPLQVNFN